MKNMINIAGGSPRGYTYSPQRHHYYTAPVKAPLLPKAMPIIAIIFGLVLLPKLKGLLQGNRQAPNTPAESQATTPQPATTDEGTTRPIPPPVKRTNPSNSDYPPLVLTPKTPATPETNVDTIDDDGVIDKGQKWNAALHGAGKNLKGMVNLKTAGIIAGAAALGFIFPPSIPFLAYGGAALGIGVGGYNLIEGAQQANQAETGQEAIAAWETIGSGSTDVLLGITGGVGYAKYGKAIPSRLQGKAKGTYTQGKTKVKAGFKDAKTKADAKFKDAKAGFKDAKTKAGTKFKDAKAGFKDAKTKAGAKFKDAKAGFKDAKTKAGAKFKDAKAGFKDAKTKAGAKFKDAKAGFKDAKTKAGAKFKDAKAGFNKFKSHFANSKAKTQGPSPISWNIKNENILNFVGKNGADGFFKRYTVFDLANMPKQKNLKLSDITQLTPEQKLTIGTKLYNNSHQRLKSIRQYANQPNQPSYIKVQLKGFEQEYNKQLYAILSELKKGL